MTKLFLIVAITLGLLCTSAMCEIVDRIIVTVNSGAVLASDVDETLRYAALVDGKSFENPGGDDITSAVDRLIDQELLKQEMASDVALRPVTDSDVTTHIDDIRKELKVESDDQWRALLARYGLSESAFQRRVRNQLEVIRFIDSRLRPNVRVDRNAVETYYKETFVPSLGAAGQQNPPPLQQVQSRIREILVQKRIDELLNAWLHNLRQQAVLRYFDVPHAQDSTTRTAGRRE